MIIGPQETFLYVCTRNPFIGFWNFERVKAEDLKY